MKITTPSAFAKTNPTKPNQMLLRPACAAVSAYGSRSKNFLIICRFWCRVGYFFLALDFALVLLDLAFVFFPARQPHVLHICHPFTFDIQYRLGGATAFVPCRYVSRPAGASQSRYFGRWVGILDGTTWRAKGVAAMTNRWRSWGDFACVPAGQW
jgi:hypothetical protein